MNDWLAHFDKDGNFTLDEFGVCRFTHDHLNVDGTFDAIVLDGLILNQRELFRRYKTEDFETLVRRLHSKHPTTFFKYFRGPFTGLYYDKRAKKAIVFTNQTGDSAVFYYKSKKHKVFSSNFNLVLDFLKSHKIKVSLDEKAAHWMLTFGYLIDDATFAYQIKRLRPGKAIYLHDGKWDERRYHQFESNCLDITEDEAIERIDKLFRQAVERCFSKDWEYGFRRHLVDMSAGMDSRMVNCVAKALRHNNITNISYSQSGSEEAKLAQQASELFRNKMIFEPLDNHEFIYDIDKLLDGQYGTYLYCGITGGARLLSKLNIQRFGAEHTGQLGDIAIGTFVKTKSIEVDPEAVRLSHRLPLQYDPNPEKFENQDLYSLYTRGFMGAMSSWFIRKQYTFALSPFTDVDFMGFCYSLPIEMRRNHNLYWKWVERYYPKALKVPTSRKRVPITLMKKTKDLFSRAYQKGMKEIRKMRFEKGRVPSRVLPESSMNPYEYWYDTDPRMRAFFDKYYSKNLPLLKKHPALQNDVTTMFESPVVLEKLMALTVLGMAKKLKK